MHSQVSLRNRAQAFLFIYTALNEQFRRLICSSERHSRLDKEFRHIRCFKVAFVERCAHSPGIRLNALHENLERLERAINGLFYFENSALSS